MRHGLSNIDLSRTNVVSRIIGEKTHVVQWKRNRHNVLFIQTLDGL